MGWTVVVWDLQLRLACILMCQCKCVDGGCVYVYCMCLWVCLGSALCSYEAHLAPVEM